MSVIIRLQGLSWSASAMDIRNFFKGLNIPPGGVHIIGGDRGDAFIAFSTDEDARRAMLLNNGKLNDMPVMLFLSSKTEMQNTIIEAKERSTAVSAPPPSTQQPISSAIPPSTAINPSSHQLPVIPGLGMQPHLPQINQLSHFLSGLLPNSDLTSSVVSKLINQQQQQQQHIGQLKLPSTSSPGGSSFKALNEHALPGEYSVGGIPQGNMPTHNYINQQGLHGNREMPPFGMNRGNVQPPISVAYSQSTQGMTSAISSANSQSGMNDHTQSMYSNRSENERRAGEQTNQENLERPNFYEGRNHQMPRPSRWTDKERRTDTSWSAPPGGREDNGRHNLNKQNNARSRTADNPLTSAPVSTSALNTKQLNSLPVASTGTGGIMSSTVTKNENEVRPQNVSNKKPQTVESRLPITIMDDDETELDEFGRTVRKRPTTDSPSSKRESRDSRERSRDRDRSRRRDSPRRDRRDRDRRDRDRRDRDRDRDRRNRDRDDDRRDRYREQDRRTSPATSDSYRRSKKRSLSPSNTNEKEADKKLQTDKQDNTKPSLKAETASANTNDVKTGLPENPNNGPLGGINLVQTSANSSGPPPIFPAIPPVESGKGILGAAPPGYLNPGKGEKNSILPEPDAMHLNRPFVAHKEDFNGNEPSNRIDGPLISEIDGDNVYQRSRFAQESRGSQEFPRHPVAERNVPMDYRGHSADRTEPMFENNPQKDMGPLGFMRGPPNREPQNEENMGRADFNRGPPNRGGPPNREGMHVKQGSLENNQGPIEMEPFLEEARGHPDFHQGPPNREPPLGVPGRHPDINRGFPNRKPDNNPRHPDFMHGPPNRGGFPDDSVGPFGFNKGPQNREYGDSRRNPDLFHGTPIGHGPQKEAHDQIDYNREPFFEENRGHPDFNQRRPDRGEHMMEDGHGTQDFSRTRPHRGPLLEETQDRPDFHQGRPARRGLLEESRGPPDITRGPIRGALLGDPPGLRNRMEESGPNAFIDGRHRGALSLLGDGPRDLPPRDNRGPWDRDNEEIDQQMDFLPHMQEDSAAINGPPNDFRGPAEFGVRDGDFEYQQDLRDDRFDGRPPMERGGIGRGAPNDRPFRGGRAPFDSHIRPSIEPRPMQFNPERPGPMAGRQHLNDLSEGNPDMPMPGNRSDRFPGEFGGRARVDQPAAPRRRTLLEDPVSLEMSPEFMGMSPRNTPDFPNRTSGHHTESQRFPPQQDGFPPQNRQHNNRVGPLHGTEDMNKREFRQNSGVGNRREYGRRDDRGFPRPPFPERSERRDRHGAAGSQSDNTRAKPPQEQPRSREPSKTRDRDPDRDPRERGSRDDSKRDEDPRKQTTIETSDPDKTSTVDKKLERQEPKPKKDTTVKGDFYVSMANIPLEFSHGDIAKLYSDCAIARKGIKVINDSTGKRTGKAYVQFCNADSHAAALKISGSVLGKRIIAVNQVPKKEFIDAVDSYEPDSDEEETDRERSKKIDLCNTLTATLMNLKGESMTFPAQNKGKNNVSATKSKEESKPDQQKNNNNQTSAYFVMVGQLSEKTSLNDIRNLFKNCSIAQNGDAIKLGEVVKGVRQCFVEFADEKSLKSALQTKRVFRGSTIIIKQSTKTEFDRLLNQAGRDSATHEKAGNDGNSDKLGDSAAVDKNKQSVDKDLTCIRVTNLPYDFHHHDFRRLFDGVGVAPRGIQVCHDALGQTLGEGCVELLNHIEAKKAQQKDGLVIGRNKIRVELITKQMLIDHMRHAKQALRPELASQPQVFYFVKAENLPANVSTGEIINFFNGYRPSPESIRLNVGDKTDDPNCSTALVGFRQREDAERAVHDLNKFPLRNRTIALEKVIL